MSPEKRGCIRTLADGDEGCDQRECAREKREKGSSRAVERAAGGDWAASSIRANVDRRDNDDRIF